MSATFIDELVRQQPEPLHAVPTVSDDEGPIPFNVQRIGDMAARVDAAGAPRFLVRRLVVEGDYGTMGAERKFGKTWLSSDLVVNVAAGGSFLGRFPVDVQGTVLLFAGEGGERKIVRRLRAVAAFYDHELATLPLWVYERAPKLGSNEQIERMAATVAQLRPVLIVIDPAYLAIAGAETSNLVSMGMLLERAQIIAQDHGAALLMTHHWNKTGQGTNVDRFTGTGFAEWSRFLMSGSTLSNNTDKATGATTRVCKLEVTGDEVGDTEVVYRRRVWTDDPDDLTSAMHYEVEVIDDAEGMTHTDEPEVAGMKPAAKRILKVLRAQAGAWLDHVQIGDALANEGHPLKKRTILEAGQALVDGGLVRELGGVGAVRKTWCAHDDSTIGGGNVV